MIIKICCKRTQHDCMNYVWFFFVLCVCVCVCVWRKRNHNDNGLKTTPHGAIKKVHGQYSLVRATMEVLWQFIKEQGLVACLFWTSEACHQYFMQHVELCLLLYWVLLYNLYLLPFLQIYAVKPVILLISEKDYGVWMISKERPTDQLINQSIIDGRINCWMGVGNQKNELGERLKKCWGAVLCTVEMDG